MRCVKREISIIGVLFAIILCNYVNALLDHGNEHFPTPHKLQLTRVLYDFDLPLPHAIHELNQFESGSNYDNLRSRGRKLDFLPAELAPLYPGYGTHFIYIYVGTPPQRQSVIVDTGSHYTAFPCIGCSQCGSHTDEYFDWKNSSTAKVSDCNGQPCVISQSYSEGSSWRAITVSDKVWVGGLTGSTVKNGAQFSTDFSFGCQTSETGLFRTQLADGIMGLSMSDDTLPFVLARNKIIDSKIFSLCFRIGGGIMTIGGVDQRIHSKPGILYAKLTKPNGWFTVKILDIQLQDQAGSTTQTLGIDVNVVNSGKGCIVDSGTTDTYLPSAIASKFSNIFRDISGIAFTSANFQLTAQQLSKIPNILYTFEGVDGQPFTIVMPWTSYLDSVGGGKYAFRVYLTEGQGAVLGANFMNGYNIIFDPDNGKLGFAKSNCKFEDFVDAQTRTPTTFPTGLNGEIDSNSGSHDGNVRCESSIVPLTDCSANCLPTTGIVSIKGEQEWGDSCGGGIPREGSLVRSCSLICKDGIISRGNLSCPDTSWSTCDRACIQKRFVPLDPYFNELGNDNNTDSCQYKQQTRSCYSGLCPYVDGDYLVYIDMRMNIDPRKWSWVHTEDMFASFAALFEIRESAIELINDPTKQSTLGTKLHFQIRIKSRDYSTLEELNNAAQNIPNMIWGATFNDDVIKTLESNSQRLDKVDHSRFGWLVPHDIEILNAVAIPIGKVRDPINIPIEVNKSSFGFVVDRNNLVDMFLLGLALVSLIFVCCMSWFHYRLRLEFERVSKDKQSGSLAMLRNLGSKFISTSRIDGKGQYSQLKTSEILNDEEIDGDDENAEYRL